MFPLLHIDTFISKLSKINSLEHGTPWAWVLYRISNGGLWRTSCEIAHADRGQCTHPVWGVSKVELQTEHPPLCGADCKMMFQTRNSIFDPNFEIFKNELLN
jgi:hypothetical protein